MVCYSVLAVTPTSNDWFDEYVAVSTPIVRKYGGKFLASTSSHERLEGEGEEVALRVIVEWPDKDAVLACWKDPEYLPQLEARTKGSKSEHIIIEGKNDRDG